MRTILFFIICFILICIVIYILFFSYEDVITKMMLLTMVTVVFLFFIALFNGTIKPTESDYKIINESELNELLKEGKMNEFETSYIFYEVETEILKEQVSNCSVVYGSDYNYKREVNVMYVFGTKVSSDTTCEITIPMKYK